MTEEQNAQLEIAMSLIGETIEDTLEVICGSQRGFMLFIFKAEPTEPGDGLMLTNVEQSCVHGLLQDAMATLGDPHDSPTLN